MRFLERGFLGVLIIKMMEKYLVYRLAFKRIRHRGPASVIQSRLTVMKVEEKTGKLMVHCRPYTRGVMVNIPVNTGGQPKKTFIISEYLGVWQLWINLFF